MLSTRTLLATASLVALACGTDRYANAPELKAKDEARRAALEACVGGDTKGCANYCADRNKLLLSDEQKIGMRQPEACERACDGGDEASCLTHAEKLLKTDPAGARRTFEARCEQGKGQACWLLVRHFGNAKQNPVAPERVARILEERCAAGNVLPCFLRAMNTLGSTGDVQAARALVEPVAAKSSPSVDQWGAQDLLGCLDGREFGTARELTEVERQEKCVAVQTLLTTNFGYARLYTARPGELAALPWGAAGPGRADPRLLPGGRGWSCCGYVAPAGYTGEYLNVCERTKQACAARMARIDAPGYVSMPPTEHSGATVYCSTQGPSKAAPYTCVPDEALCRGQRSVYGSCLRWGNVDAP